MDVNILGKIIGLKIPLTFIDYYFICGSLAVDVVANFTTNSFR
jgi:hypothetical protein